MKNSGKLHHQNDNGNKRNIQNSMRTLNVEYDNLTLRMATERALTLLATQNKATVFFLNADYLYKAQNDKAYRDILNSANLVLPDGIGLRLATRILGGKMKENCNGSDFSPLFMKKAAEKGYKMFFLGERDGVAEKAAETIRKNIAKIQIVGTNSGYFESDGEVISKINKSGADILFVGMGAPFQEKWISRNIGKLNVALCLGVGGFLGYPAGLIKRAPRIMRIFCLEWLWRIFMEPRRMFKRYIVDGMKFFWLVLRQKYFGG